MLAWGWDREPFLPAASQAVWAGEQALDLKVTPGTPGGLLVLGILGTHAHKHSQIEG